MRKASEKAMLILKEIIERRSVKRYGCSEGEGGGEVEVEGVSERHAAFIPFFVGGGGEETEGSRVSTRQALLVALLTDLPASTFVVL